MSLIKANLTNLFNNTSDFFHNVVAGFAEKGRRVDYGSAVLHCSMWYSRLVAYPHRMKVLRSSIFSELVRMCI